MKIVKSHLLTIELSFDELVAIKKIIGSTSSYRRTNELGLTDEQDKAASKLYEMLAEYFGGAE